MGLYNEKGVLGVRQYNESLVRSSVFLYTSEGEVIDGTTAAPDYGAANIISATRGDSICCGSNLKSNSSSKWYEYGSLAGECRF